MVQSTEDIDKFYRRLDNVKIQCKLQEITVIMEDLIAKVENEQDGEIFGKYGLEYCNKC